MKKDYSLSYYSSLWSLIAGSILLSYGIVSFLLEGNELIINFWTSFKCFCFGCLFLVFNWGIGFDQSCWRRLAISVGVFYVISCYVNQSSIYCSISVGESKSLFFPFLLYLLILFSLIKNFWECDLTWEPSLVLTIVSIIFQSFPCSIIPEIKSSIPSRNFLCSSFSHLPYWIY